MVGNRLFVIILRNLIAPFQGKPSFRRIVGFILLQTVNRVKDKNHNEEAFVLDT
jgi:hypothetical protein